MAFIATKRSKDMYVYVMLSIFVAVIASNQQHRHTHSHTPDSQAAKLQELQTYLYNIHHIGG